MLKLSRPVKSHDQINIMTRKLVIGHEKFTGHGLEESSPNQTLFNQSSKKINRSNIEPIKNTK